MTKQQKQTIDMSTLTRSYKDGSIHFRNDTDNKTEDGILTIPKEDLKRLKHPEWAPTWDPKDDHKFENPKPFKVIDRGFAGDPSFESFKHIDSIHFKHISPKLGLEVDGIQLSALNDQQKNDLALLVEKHGVIAFRNQDFKNQSFEAIKEWGKYFGPLHVHPTSGSPLNHPEFHMTFRRGSKEEYGTVLEDQLNSIGWHSDTTYENQTPGLTLFSMLQMGESGGDTQFIDMVEVYDRLSPLFKDLIGDLKAVHTSKEQANAAKSEGGIERKAAIDSIHPVVRYHPVLNRKSLFVNRAFTRKILGLKTEESDNLLLFLFNHTASCLDAHVRLQWDENTVVIWDNRRLLHSRTLDWDSEDIRHAFRVTTIAERPIGSKEEYESWTPAKEEENIKLTEYLISLNAENYYKNVILNTR